MSLVSSAASKGVTPIAIFTAFSIIADLGDFYFFKAVKLRLGLYRPLPLQNDPQDIRDSSYCNFLRT